MTLLQTNPNTSQLTNTCFIGFLHEKTIPNERNYQLIKARPLFLISDKHESSLQNMKSDNLFADKKV